MIHQDVTAMQLVRFIRNQSNIDSLYHIVGQLSKEEFGFLMLAQQSEEDAVAFLDRNQQVLRSMADKLQDQLCSALELQPKLELDFDSVYEEARKIQVSGSMKFSRTVHNYEYKHKLLISDMSVEQIEDFVRENQQHSTITIYKNTLQPLSAYVQTLMSRNLTNVFQNVISKIDYKTIDFSDVLRHYSFASEQEVLKFIDEIAHPIEHNIASNRVSMIILLCYAGVRPNDILTLKETDLKDGKLLYDGALIPVHPLVTQILNRWKKDGSYSIREDSIEVTPLIDNDALVKSHRLMKMTDYGTALKNLILRSKTTHTETTYTDVYSAGAYARFVATGEYNNAERNRVVYENDVRNWIRAFDIQLTDEQKSFFQS